MPLTPAWFRVRVSASQHGRVGEPAEVLLRLKRLLGLGRIERHGEPDDFKWVAEGARDVASVLAVVSPYLGASKRADATRALSAFNAQPRERGDRDHCVRGHAYTYVKTPDGRVKKVCRVCTRLLDRRGRARLGIAPRKFKDLTRRYTE
jgi:hypothetical protein